MQQISQENSSSFSFSSSSSLFGSSSSSDDGILSIDNQIEGAKQAIMKNEKEIVDAPVEISRQIESLIDGRIRLLSWQLESSVENFEKFDRSIKLAQRELRQDFESSMYALKKVGNFKKVLFEQNIQEIRDMISRCQEISMSFHKQEDEEDYLFSLPIIEHLEFCESEIPFAVRNRNERFKLLEKTICEKDEEIQRIRKNSLFLGNYHGCKNIKTFSPIDLFQYVTQNFPEIPVEKIEDFIFNENDSRSDPEISMSDALIFIQRFSNSTNR